MKSFIFITLLSMSFNLFATNDFECTVKEVYKLNESGLLAPEKGSVTPDVSSKFIVNRQSGQITGKNITNTMSGNMPTVYSYLPSENSYSALTIYKPNYTIDLLQIQEHIEGKLKPFIYKGAFGEVVTGLCTIQ
jgi:hypothetical protein